jgi:hypothetical protein
MFSGRIDPISSPPALPFVFIIVLIRTRIPAAPHSCQSRDLYVIYITDARQKTGEKPAE